MRKRSFIPFAALALALALAGCGSFSYTFTTAGNRTTIEINDVEDGEAADSGVISVGKDRAAVIESALEKGQLQIDFTEAAVFHNEDTPDDVMLGDVAQSVTVEPGTKETLSLERGDYVLQVTAVGNTGGKVTVNIEKE